MKVIYLDVKDISGLVRGPTPEGARLISALRRGDFSLAFSLVHLQELSSPEFKSMADVGQFLDSVPLAWGVHVDVLWDLECKQLLRSGPKRKMSSVRVFHPDAAKGWEMPLNAQIPTSQMLRELSEEPSLRQHMKDLAEHGIMRRAQVGTEAVVVKELLRPAVSRLVAKTAEWGRPITESTARWLLSNGGVETCMPSYLGNSLLTRSRAGDPSFPNDPNDILDELHAAYVPYVEAAVLDRRTAGRFRSSKCPGSERAHRNVAQLVEAIGC